MIFVSVGQEPVCVSENGVKSGISVRILVQSGSSVVSGFDTFHDWHLPGVKSDTRAPQHRNRELFTPWWLMAKLGCVQHGMSGTCIVFKTMPRCIYLFVVLWCASPWASMASNKCWFVCN